MRLIWTYLVVLALAGLAAAQTMQTPGESRLLAQHSSQTDDSKEHLDHPNWLGPFVPTPAPVVDAVLELAKVGESDLVYDLGSGDGRIILAAAQRFQARSVGIEWNQALCEKTSSAIQRLGLEGRVKVIQGDIFNQDVSSATVVTGYLLPNSWDRLAPILERQLRKGVRVVSVNDPIPGWRVVEKKQLKGESQTASWDLYLYRIR
jgi:SAM-dependent methyltransferase